MNFFDWLLRRKVSEARIVSTIQQAGKAQPTPANYEGFSKEGYQKNVVAFACINKIAVSAAAVPWFVKRKDVANKNGDMNHPIIQLLKRPNPLQGGAEFMQNLFGYYALTGNTYMEANGQNGNLPAELWSVRPDKMRVIAGNLGMPAAYNYKDGSYEKSWDVNPITGESLIMHIRTFNPTNYWYGMSPLEAALSQVDQNNAANQWNLSLLQNAATPSGILKVVQGASNPTGTLNDTQITRLRAMVDEKFTGRRNNAKPMVLESGLEWQAIAWSPKDMEFLESKNTTSRDIALAFGVPPLLLNINGDNTFRNYAEARVAFYEDTIIPMLRVARDAFNKYFEDALGGLELDFDIDQIDAMAPKRAEKFNSYKDANFLTVNEKREAIGYPALPDGDVILVGAQVVSFDMEVFNELPPALPEPSKEEDQQAKANQGHGFKSFNLIGKTERQQSAAAQNRRMRKWEKSMANELEGAFADLNKKIASEVMGVDKALQDYTIMHVVKNNSKPIEDILRKYIGTAARDFAGQVLRDGKQFIDAEFETKEAEETKARARTKVDQFIEEFLKTHVTKGLDNILGTTIKRARVIVNEEVTSGIAEGNSNTQIADSIRKRMDGVTRPRADLIARTEVGIASQNGSLEAAKALGVPNMVKEWVSLEDDRTRDNPAIADHRGMNGVAVGINEKFKVEPDADMECPKDKSAPPEQVCNCRCVLVYSIGAGE